MINIEKFLFLFQYFNTKLTKEGNETIAVCKIIAKFMIENKCSFKVNLNLIRLKTIQRSDRPNTAMTKTCEIVNALKSSYISQLYICITLCFAA